MSRSIFSIIIPTYDRRLLLERAVLSVMAQEYSQWELIIIDDGSTDDTKTFVNGIDDKRVKYYYQKNRGRSAARNLGIEKATGKYICFLDSDDELLPNYLLVFQDLLSDELEVLIAGVRLQGKNTSKVILPAQEKKQIIIQTLQGNFNLMPFCFPSVILDEVSFEEDVFYGEDFQFLIPIILHQKIVSAKIETSIVHEHNDRTISRVFDHPDVAHTQFELSIINTINSNNKKLIRLIGADILSSIREEKIRSFLLTLAKKNYTKAIIVRNNYQNIGVAKSELLMAKIKGVIAKFVGK